MALLLPRAKTRQPVKIKIESKVEAEVEPKVESEVECDGVRNWMRPRIRFKLINTNSNENWRTQIQRKAKTKNVALGFATLFLHGGVLAWPCLISVTFIQMKLLLLLVARTKGKGRNQNQVQSQSRGRTQGRIRGWMRWRPKLNMRPIPIQTSKRKFERKLGSVNSNENENKTFQFWFCPLVLHGSVLDC